MCARPYTRAVHLSVGVRAFNNSFFDDVYRGLGPFKKKQFSSFKTRIFLKYISSQYYHNSSLYVVKYL